MKMDSHINPAGNSFRAHARVLTASSVGTAAKFCDFYIFGTAAGQVIGPLVCPALPCGIAGCMNFSGIDDFLHRAFSQGRWVLSTTRR